MAFRLLIVLLIANCVLLSSVLANSEPLVVDVYIDPGHGGTDHGTLGAYTDTNYSEKDVNLEIALELKDRLDLSSYTYIFSRVTDKFVPLPKRASDAMNSNAQAFISIHHNASTNPYVQHTLAFYCSTAFVQDTNLIIERNTDNKLAHKSALKISQLLGHVLGSGTPQGVRHANFDVLKRTSMA